MQPHTAYPALRDLPALVKQQRTLEATIAPLGQILDDEKAVRQQIDALLIEAGIEKNDGVTCVGYDVVHHERAGSTRINQERLIGELVAAGIDPDTADAFLTASTETGDPSAWATVKPSKGAKVRLPPMAKAR